MPISTLTRPESKSAHKAEPVVSQLPSAEWLELAASLTETRSAWKQGTDFGKRAGESLEWSLSNLFCSHIRSELSHLFAKKGLSAAKWKKIHQAWGEWQAHPAESESHAWEALVWLRVLVAHHSQFTAEEASALLNRLWELSQATARQNPSHDPLQFQWLAIELPWCLGLLAGEQPMGETCRHAAQQALQAWFHCCTDEPGTVAGRYLPYLPLILASWTRCLQLAQAFQAEFLIADFLPPEPTDRFSLLLQQALRTMRSDGSAVFTEPETGSLLEWLPAACEFADRPTRQFAKAMAKEHSKRKQEEDSLPTASYQPTGKWASLRRSCARNDLQIGVAFDGPRVQLEVAHETTLLSGAWDLEFAVNGEKVEQTQDWEEVLWFDDADVTYLELQTYLGHDWTLQRQILLPAMGDFVLLADCLVGEEASDMQYRSHFSLAPEVGFTAAEETHEGWLTHGKKRWLTMPLACPEWRSERAHYELTAAGHQLTYTGARHGRCMFQPLFLATAPLGKKADPQYTWRRLTVAEHMEIQGPDIAFAARVQIAQEQWILYRSLLERGNRTFLGKNVATEFFFGKFDADEGTYETIMEVQ
jgi:hypothetical protein